MDIIKIDWIDVLLFIVMVLSILKIILILANKYNG